MSARLLLLTPLEGEMLERLRAIYAPVARIEILRDASDFQAVSVGDDDLLLAVGTGEISTLR